MAELDMLFRYTAMYLIDEVLSPVVTPLILISNCRINPKKLLISFVTSL